MPVNLPIHNPFPQHEESKDTATSSAPKSSIALEKAGSTSDQTLASVLSTPELRSDLTLLLATITTRMRGDVTAIFDPRYVTASIPGALAGSAPLGTNPLSPTASKDAPALGKIDVASADKARKTREKIVNELSEKDVQDLKKAVLEFFDKWREDVLTRVGKVVNSEEEAKHQAEQVDDKTEGDKVISVRDLDKKVTETVMAEEGVHHESEKKDKELEKPVDDSTIIINEQAEKMLPSLYPRVPTKLTTALTDTQRRLVLHAVLLLLLSLEHYTGYSRILLLQLTSSLQLSLSFLSADESSTARTLLTAVALSADQETKSHEKSLAHSRAWKVGLASVAGAAIIGVTGGFAAPLVAAGVGTLMAGVGLEATAAATYLGAVAGSEMLIGGLFGAYGGSMAGKAMDEYARAVSDFGFVPVHGFHRPRKIESEYRRLRVCIGISGWLTEREEVIKPWRVITTGMETFALRWELEALLKLGNSLTGVLRSTAWAYAKKKLIEKTVLGVLFEALWPLSLLRVAKLIENPFSVAVARADKAGEVLADALANKVQGSRPVTLVGYSMGARVISACLQKLAKKRAFGLIENAILLGTPEPADSEDWRNMRAVVSGRLVNVYSNHDLILGFLYRGTSLELGVAGLQPITGVPGVENVDVSELISGHLRYRFLSGSILKKIGFEDLDVELVEEEEAEMEALEELEEKERKEKEEKDKKEGKSEEQIAKDVEADVEKRNKDTMMDWAKAKLALGKDKFDDFWKSKDDEDDKAEVKK